MTKMVACLIFINHVPNESPLNSSHSYNCHVRCNILNSHDCHVRCKHIPFQWGTIIDGKMSMLEQGESIVSGGYLVDLGLVH